MRGFTQTLVNTLFGWIRILVEGVWNLLFSNETQRWLQWVGENWLALVVFLCLCGVVLDYLIWFLRWRPYYVWASSMRRMKRIFGGGKAPEDKKVPRERRKRQPAPVPVQKQVPEPELFEALNGGDDDWEEQNWEQPAVQEQPDLTGAIMPAVTADTILARPRKMDYQEQYVRRFARPQAEEPQATTLWQEEPVEDWPNEQQEYMGEPEPASEEESWVPEVPAPSADQPLHPGIDYQALSRQYGWHRETEKSGAKAPDELDAAEGEQPQEVAGPAWNFSGLENFSPYRVPTPPAEREQRMERTRKARTDNTPLSKVKSGLSRIAQRAGKVLTVDDEEESKLIDGLPPPIDKRRAFHAPVYPNRPGTNPTNTKKNPDFQEDD